MDKSHEDSLHVLFSVVNPYLSEQDPFMSGDTKN